jgi:hypothetical protein
MLSDRESVLDVIEAVKKILAYTASVTLAEFLANDEKQDDVLGLVECSLSWDRLHFSRLRQYNRMLQVILQFGSFRLTNIVNIIDR